MSRRTMIECDRCGVEVKEEDLELTLHEQAIEPRSGTVEWKVPMKVLKMRQAKYYRDDDEGETAELCQSCFWIVVKKALPRDVTGNNV